MQLGCITEKKIKQLVYTVWVCLKAITQRKTLKEESTNKNHTNDKLQSIIDEHNKLSNLKKNIFTIITIQYSDTI